MSVIEAGIGLHSSLRHHSAVPLYIFICWGIALRFSQNWINPKDHQKMMFFKEWLLIFFVFCFFFEIWNLMFIHCNLTSHSAYVATETELYGAKIDGLLPPNFCRCQKCKRKVPPPSLLSNDFEKSWVFSTILVMFFFLLIKIFRPYKGFFVPNFMYCNVKTKIRVIWKHFH